MDLIGDQNRSDLLHFAVRLKTQLNPVSLLEIEQAPARAKVTGILNLSHDGITTSISTKCCFTFGPNWMQILPKVETEAVWLRRGDPKWHTFSDGSLCFVYRPHWRDQIRAALDESDVAKAAEFAVMWCVRSTRWLLYRHHFAHEHGITEWPKDWPSWSHDGTEQLAYERLRKDAELGYDT